MVPNAQIKQSPGLNDVTAYGCVHETGKQWHTEYFCECRVGITPGLDAAGCLEYFQHESDQVKQGNGLEFIQSFKLECNHASLNGESDDQQQVITGNAE